MSRIGLVLLLGALVTVLLLPWGPSAAEAAAEFADDRPEFERVVSWLPAREPVPDGAPDETGRQDVEVPPQTGDECIRSATYVPRGGVVFFDCEGSGLLDDAGFAFLPEGPSADLENGSFERSEFAPARCDLEHTRPWPRGSTEATDLAPRSRRHHRAEQAGWTPDSLPDGSTLWSAPSGRTYRRPPAQ